MKLIRFGIIGVANTLTDYSVYWLLLAIGTLPQNANLMSIGLTATLSFAANRRYTFSSTNRDTSIVHQLLKHSAVTCGALLLSGTIIYLLVRQLGPLGAKAIAIPLVLIWNYTLSSTWVWAKGTHL